MCPHNLLSDEDYALRTVRVANPGLVDFSVISLAFSYRFGQPPVAPATSEVQMVPLTP